MKLPGFPAEQAPSSPTLLQVTMQEDAGQGTSQGSLGPSATSRASHRPAVPLMNLGPGSVVLEPLQEGHGHASACKQAPKKLCDMEAVDAEHGDGGGGEEWCSSGSAFGGALAAGPTQPVRLRAQVRHALGTEVVLHSPGSGLAGPRPGQPDHPSASLSTTAPSPAAPAAESGPLAAAPAYRRVLLAVRCGSAYLQGRVLHKLPSRAGSGSGLGGARPAAGAEVPTQQQEPASASGQQQYKTSVVEVSGLYLLGLQGHSLTCSNHLFLLPLSFASPSKKPKSYT